MLIPYICSFTSYNPSFLKWVWTQTTSSLKKLELQWDYTVETNAYSELLVSIPQSRVDKLTFALKPALEFRILSSRGVFNNLTFLYLQNHATWKYPLQTILDQLHAPSLEILKVENLTDWRIQWRESFDDTMPNLAGLSLHIRGGDEDVVMFDSEEDYETEENMPPSNVKWDTVLTLYRRSIFFEMILLQYSSNPFLDPAPSYASAHQLDPVLLVQWLVKSSQFLRAKQGIDYFCVWFGDIPLSDLTTILRSIKSMDFRPSKMELGLHLPLDTTPSIADLLPDNIVELELTSPSDGFLDPSVVPECIRRLPNLERLLIWINAVAPRFRSLSRCTAAKCSFQSLELEGRTLKAARGSDPFWSVSRRPKRDIDKDDLGDVDDLEMEIKEWFRLSTSLKYLEIIFKKVEQFY